MNGSGQPKVLFIGGYARSGSTIVERILSQIEGIVGIGELGNIWHRGLAQNLLCGCGEPFRSCEFWSVVLTKALGGLDSPTMVRAFRVASRVARWSRVPLALAGHQPRGLASDARDYADILESLYRAIAEISGCDVVVDSTKEATHAYILTQIDSVDLAVLHLVRDSRAVAHSLQRRKYDPGLRKDIPRVSPVRASLAWAASNAMLSPIRRRCDYMFLRYEDFARRPQAGTQKILRLLGCGDRPMQFDARGRPFLGLDHTVAGNPIRFQRGPVEIRLDEEWRLRMPPGDRLIVTALTLPSLLSYGYRLGYGPILGRAQKH